MEYLVDVSVANGQWPWSLVVNLSSLVFLSNCYTSCSPPNLNLFRVFFVRNRVGQKKVQFECCGGVMVCELWEGG